MNRKRWLVVIVVVGAAITTGCDSSVRSYLGKTGQMTEWQTRLAKAVCQLEEKNPTGLLPEKRICPNGQGGPGDKTGSPSYPPQ